MQRLFPTCVLVFFPTWTERRGLMFPSFDSIMLEFPTSLQMPCGMCGWEEGVSRLLGRICSATPLTCSRGHLLALPIRELM